mgnify:CR=1 FL=1
MHLSVHADEAIANRAAAMVENRFDFLRELVKRRIDLGLTQAEVADLLGITPQAVSKYERYDWDPRLSTLERYANAVGAVLRTTVSPCPWSSTGDKLSFEVSIKPESGQTSITIPVHSITRQDLNASGWARAAESKRTDFALSA